MAGQDPADMLDEQYNTEKPPDSSISQTDALAYWNTQTSDVNGMLGGFGAISRVDLQGSRVFLNKLRRHLPHHDPQKPLGRAVDCGAGIGRITFGLLIKLATTVDVVEPVQKFTKELEARPEYAECHEKGSIGNIVNLGLEVWDPSEKVYDLIWNQWCLGQLNDAQLTAYLIRCKPALTEGGWIHVKENMSNTPDDSDIFDPDDSSVTRSDAKFRKIFKDAKLKIVMTEVQKGFPQDLYPVRTYALQPE